MRAVAARRGKTATQSSAGPGSRRRTQSATRRRLETGLPVGERANLSKIVAMATVDRIASRSIEGTLGALRNLAQGGFRRAAAERPDIPASESDDARDEP